jgi:hypothetical protein
MHIETLRISDVRYNPERGAFEALVTVHDGQTVFRYPAHVTAPLHAGFALISRGLVEQATAQHRSARPGLRMRVATATNSAPVPLAA